MRGLHLECAPDECIAKMLGRTRKYITHHTGKARVCKHLQKNKSLIGLMDEDPGTEELYRYLKKFQYANKYNIRYAVDKERGNNIVILCPRLEDWIIEVCKNNKVSIKKYGLNNTPNGLHKEINQKLDKLEELIEHLVKIKSKEILHLKMLLKG